MSDGMVSFDDMRGRVKAALAETGIPGEAGDIYLVRDLFGKLRMCVSDRFRENSDVRCKLERVAASLHKELGPHGYAPDDGVLFMSAPTLESFDAADAARASVEGFDRVFWVERLITGGAWWTVDDRRPEPTAKRWTLFSVKGGVGRSTTAAVLARHFAGKGERVLVIDLDLESPGLSSAMLGHKARPKLGVTDWFVEELVKQGDRVIERMTTVPDWSHDMDGEARIAPAHGANPGEYLAKLGRVYMDRREDPWTARLERMLGDLEEAFSPTLVLIESRSGLHDIAAATVTDIDADVLLFAIESESCWTDYDILFRHWQEKGKPPNIRERLSTVSALIPPDEEAPYLRRFRHNAWKLFRSRLYDDEALSTAAPRDRFWFDLHEEGAPHDPLLIYWTRGLAAIASLEKIDPATVEQAYGSFLKPFERLIESGRG